MVLGGKEGLKYEVCVDRLRLEHVSKFKYLGCVLDESGADEAECSRKMESGRRVVRLWLMLGACSLSVLGSCMSHCWSLFLRIVVRQWYGGRRRYLGLGLYRTTT